MSIQTRKSNRLMLSKVIRCCIIGILVLVTMPSYAQTTPTTQDFSNVHVDQLTDAQIRAFMKQVESSGLGQDQLEQIATSKGMSPTEVDKLKKRVEKLKKEDETKPTKEKNTKTRTVNGTEEKDQIKEGEKRENKNPYNLTEEQLKTRDKIFGAALFANANPTFEPNLRLATPVDYQIGPDDEILIDIYGYSEASYQLKVTPEGTINIPMAGIVPVSGATMAQASARIKSKLTKIYTGISTGATSVNISLGNIRSIKVVLTGEIMKPGTYTLPSVATVFNALYSSGGPSLNGSFRTIQVIRGGTVIAVLDVYDFLLYGSLKNNVRLQDQDVIRIPTYKTRVEISGEVKRPGIYEMMPGESLSDLIRFAGNFSDEAYKARIKVLKNTATERAIEDVTADDFKNYQPTTGDQYFVEKILNRFANRVKIEGAIFRPGEYELKDNLTLSQLIHNAEGLKEDAFPNRGYITRLKPDLTSELISFNTQEIVTGKQEDISLQREDIITIPSIFDLKEEYKVSINGQVRNPGSFKYDDNTSLDELIIKAGGLTESATPKRIEISRRVKNVNTQADTAQIAQLFYIDIDRNFKKETSDFILKPFDIVSVRPSPGYQVQKQVRIEGEVLYPGNYTISNKNETVSDLIKRAGGLTKAAYKDGASLKRTGKKLTQSDQEQEQYKEQQFMALQKANNDSAQVDLNDKTVRNDYVGINLPRILKRPHAKYDLLLEDGDVINIPKELQTVKVSGEILSPSSVLYSGGKGFKQYVRESGGFSPKALRKRSYVIYANGSVASTRKILLFNHYPRLKPGAEIFVPTREEKKNGFTTSELIALTTGLATIAALIITVTK